jgi:hypothetical protein
VQFKANSSISLSFCPSDALDQIARPRTFFGNPNPSSLHINSLHIGLRMGRKIIGMISSYSGLTQSDWLWQQTPQPFGIWNNIQMLKNSSNPDFLLMYQYDFYQQISRSPSWLARFQPSRSTPQISLTATELRNVHKDQIIYLMREPPLPEILPKNQMNYEVAKKYCGYISGPDDFAPTPGYMPAIWYHDNSFRELNEMPAPEKTNACSWITSGIHRTANRFRTLNI